MLYGTRPIHAKGEGDVVDGVCEQAGALLAIDVVVGCAKP